MLSCEIQTSVIPVKDSRLWRVTGSTAPLQSKVNLKLQLGNLTAHHTFYLADIADECILGMDYLKPVGVVLDLGRGLGFGLGLDVHRRCKYSSRKSEEGC